MGAAAAARVRQGLPGPLPPRVRPLARLPLPRNGRARTLNDSVSSQLVWFISCGDRTVLGEYPPAWFPCTTTPLALPSPAAMHAQPALTSSSATATGSARARMPPPRAQSPLPSPSWETTIDRLPFSSGAPLLDSSSDLVCDSGSRARRPIGRLKPAQRGARGGHGSGPYSAQQCHSGCSRRRARPRRPVATRGGGHRPRSFFNHFSSSLPNRAIHDSQQAPVSPGT